jgi:hypothetical protein
VKAAIHGQIEAIHRQRDRDANAKQGEDRRRVAGVAVIDAVSVQRLEERRTRRKLNPPNRQTLRLEPPLGLRARFDDQEDAGLLVADPQRLQRVGPRPGSASKG